MMSIKSLQRSFSLTEWVNHCYSRAVNAGWWTPDEVHDISIFAMKIALIHSEVSEMLEGLRKDRPDEHLPSRPMEEVEAADVFIRLMDYCGARAIDIEGAVIDKLEYNLERADHKQKNRDAPGGKKF